jgi:hypothetical protein
VTGRPAAERLAVKAAEIAAAVSEPELLRLLGLPRGRTLEGDLKERAEGARAWYARHGDPYLAFRRTAVAARDGSTVALEGGIRLTGAALSGRLAAGEAHALIALAASAGPAVAEEAKRLWAHERPDEAYFLDRFGAAVTERLVFWAAGALCRRAESARETLLAHLSPGCGHWDLSDQHRVMELLGGQPVDAGGESAGTVRLGPVGLLPSGALHPQHSVLAVLGVTRRVVSSTPEDLCRACDLDRCGFRRAPFARTPEAVREAR